MGAGVPAEENAGRICRHTGRDSKAVYGVKPQASARGDQAKQGATSVHPSISDGWPPVWRCWPHSGNATAKGCNNPSWSPSHGKLAPSQSPKLSWHQLQQGQWALLMLLLLPLLLLLLLQ